MKIYRVLTFYIVPTVATIVASLFYLTSDYVNLAYSITIGCALLYLMGSIYNRLNREKLEFKEKEIPNPFLETSSKE